MKKNNSLSIKRKIYLLLIIFLFSTKNLWAQPLRDPFKSQLPKIKEIIEKPIETIKIIDEIEFLEVIEEEEVVIDIEPLIIETVEPEKIIKPLPLMRVTGLVWNARRPQAIINDRIVNIGDIYEDVKIKHIHQRGIDIEFHDQMFTIEIEKLTISPI